ncbi:helix-turn-helix domain-containing protein [Acetobacterium woodii]|uniref:DNA-binding protein n=1 Tax=Acetobacterium woodii (strain ATCC 29683 / DSM 1030 / JCM 2381 / KCTC 1655 / WB1) TaxID=931626 RepID=H6LJI4_ACEWD|nr:helix-turn-helix transcriptional regulator [Acetobacterium woodii]AFA49912.1 DNA-binding protein [Acetobacterium woodii DSM 1030]
MKEINIGKIIVAKRREKGITQEDLAAYIGVSKASVSKWETGQSYPDITFLPQLSAFFNISIDDLMGYSPQLTHDDIKILYHRLAADFASKPFVAVIDECQTIIKKYYSCFPLLLQMAILFVNHHMLAAEPDTAKEILKNAATLCQRIRFESDDLVLAQEALTIEGISYLMLNQPEQVIALVGETVRPLSTNTEMLAQAYQMAGNPDKARQVQQISMFQHLLMLVGVAPSYLMLNAANLVRVDAILIRTLGVAKLYNLDELHPNTMVQVYYAAAQVYAMNQNTDKALDYLASYTHVCISDFFPFALHGDDYFDAIEPWFEDFDLGVGAVRSEAIIKKSMIDGLLANPVFDFIKEDPRFLKLVKQLNEYLKNEGA